MSSKPNKNKLLKKPKASLLKQLIRYRWAFYIQETADAVQRHKHIVLLLVIILGPVLLGVLLALAKPVMSLLHPEKMIETVQVWGAFLILIMLWSGIQRKAICGGEGYRYLTSMPIYLSARFQVELIFLGTLGGIFLVPFVIAICFIWTENTTIHALMDCICVILWVISLLMLQMLALQKNKWRWGLYFVSFISPLSLLWFQKEIISILLSSLFIFIAYRQWSIGKVSQQIRIPLPWVLRFKQKNSVTFNFFKMTLRKIFNHTTLIQNTLFIIVMWSALGMLAWFADQTGLWEIVYIEINALQLMNLVSSIYIALALAYIGVIKTSLVTNYARTDRFWMSQGITKRQLVIPEIITLYGIALITLLPTWFWIIFENGFLHSTYILLFILFSVPMIRMIYKNPEDVHGVVPLVLALLWFFISLGLLSI